MMENQFVLGRANAVVTGDIIVYNSKRDVLLIERGKDPHKGQYALIGGHFEPAKDASVKETACRECEEEVGYRPNANRVHYFRHYDAPNRDPRGRYISFVFSCNVEDDIVVKAGDDASDCRWFTQDEALRMNLAFDHSDAIRRFYLGR